MSWPSEVMKRFKAALETLHSSTHSITLEPERVVLYDSRAGNGVLAKAPAAELSIEGQDFEGATVGEVRTTLTIRIEVSAYHSLSNPQTSSDVRADLMADVVKALYLSDIQTNPLTNCVIRGDIRSVAFEEDDEEEVLEGVRFFVPVFTKFRGGDFLPLGPDDL